MSLNRKKRKDLFFENLHIYLLNFFFSVYFLFLLNHELLEWEQVKGAV